MKDGDKMITAFKFVTTIVAWLFVVRMIAYMVTRGQGATP